MNTPDDRTDLPALLRMQLRGLRTDAPPSRDLWDGIANRIANTPQQVAAVAPITARRHPVAWFAAAAVLALAVGMGWQLRPGGPATATPPTATAPVQSGNGLLVAQADAMAREYEAALREIESARGLDTTPAVLAELDASVATIRAALAQAPDSRFLFDRLQRVYAQRLSLTQRLVSA
ncbi:hypothetical protein E2F46_14980 [Luteimonas aestuarii]|uniref:Uncharacterized protein n=1 Tax=Luteimonas aestuarii TaxID=453837 RepID=A0A4R5TSX9_9GAMM|nr:hypothetical protein [Luteimonas aestuarii]TDK21535.1 hypothetical protein E2F46_14980 [Luteimonas aestuarii]